MNRAFCERVGERWNWTARLGWSEGDWRRYVQRDELQTWVGRLGDEPVGYFELERQAAGDVELVLFGLLPAFIGRGLGGPLLTAAVELAWAFPAEPRVARASGVAGVPEVPGVRRIWLHTSTDDHANALENYLRRGFVVYDKKRV